MQPPKARKPLTTEQLAARAAKSKATRTARGTAGKKQKASVKGTVIGVEITPTMVPAETSPGMTGPHPPAPTPSTATPAPAAGSTATK